MSRNLKRDYLKKLLGITTANGYKVDINNYVYNPNLSHTYPNLTKVIEETAEAYTISTVYYFKYYNGTGEYIHTVHQAPKQEAGTWYTVKEKSEKVLETSDRFNLNKLIKLAEAI